MLRQFGMQQYAATFYCNLDYICNFICRKFTNKITAKFTILKSVCMPFNTYLYTKLYQPSAFSFFKAAKYVQV